MYYPRDIEKTLLKAAASFQVIALYGSRQVGKTTTAERLFGDRFSFATLDDADELALAVENPKGFLEAHPWPLIVDEVQKAPALLGAIKQEVDAQRRRWLKQNADRELMYVLTGSNQFELQEKITESLAGRTATLQMASMTRVEKEQMQGSLFFPDVDAWMRKQETTNLTYRTKREIFDDIFMGGMPDVVSGASERDLYYKSYIDTYIEKDIRRLIAAGSEIQFRKFISLVALRTSQELNYEDIARNLGVDTGTAKRWLSILETSGIIILLEPYMANLSKRIIKSPKLYFMDAGLCAYLCKWPNAEMLSDCAMSGAFFETFVVSEIVKSFYNSGMDPKRQLYYYRDIDKKEVDLLYVDRNDLYPIEIKTSASPAKPTRNFRALEKYQMNVKAGLVIDTTDRIRPIENGKAYSFPVYLLGL